MFSGSHVVSCRRMDKHDEVNKSLLTTLQTHTKKGVTNKTHKAYFSIGRNTQILSLCDTLMYLNQEIIITLMYTVTLFFALETVKGIYSSLLLVRPSRKIYTELFPCILTVLDSTTGQDKIYLCGFSTKC